MNEAEKAYKAGNFELAKRKLDETVDGCKKIISGEPVTFRKTTKKPLEYPVILIGAIIASLTAFAIGFGYYYYQRHSLRKAVRLK